MAMSGNCGLDMSLPDSNDMIARLFSEELGLVIEYDPAQHEKIAAMLSENQIPFALLGATKSERNVRICAGIEVVLDEATPDLLNWWEQTSDQIELIQENPTCAREQAQHHDRRGPAYKLSFDPQPTPPELLERKNKPKVAIVREEGSNGDREMVSSFYAAGFEPWDVTMSDLLAGEITLDAFRGIVFVGGFSYADVLDASKGWAGIVRFSPRLKEMFDNFYNRPDTFSLGVCNGCQLMALLGWIPWAGIEDRHQPRFIRNNSQRFESRWVTVKIVESPAIMFRGMENSTLGIWVAHGEGRLHCPDPQILRRINSEKLAPLHFVDDDGNRTETYPFNPNGSIYGITGLCSPDGRHLAVMPHPERVHLKWQWPWMPEEWKDTVKASPWLRMFQNAREWCEK
jgi:phosphoribosylformylglycinamidine synthase